MMETRLQEVKRKVNGIEVQKLEATIEAINQNPDLASFRFHATNEWVDGARNRTTVVKFDGGPEEIIHRSPFLIDSDQPEVLMGKDSAPNSLIQLLHSLASCISTTIVLNASVRDINIDRLTIEMEGDVDLHGFLGLSQEVRPGFQDIRLTVDVRSDSPRQKIEELLKYAQKVSPVVDTLRNRVPVEITLKE